MSLWATSLVGVEVRHVFCGFFSSQLRCPLRVQNSSQIHQWEGFLVFRNFSSFMTPSLGRVSIPNSFVSLFVYFILPPFEENGLPFLVPDVLHQCSEVVLWKLLSIQMTFWWICWGESGLPVLFLCHLSSSPSPVGFLLKNKQISKSIWMNKRLCIHKTILKKEQVKGFLLTDNKHTASHCNNFLKIAWDQNKELKAVLCIFTCNQ